MGDQDRDFVESVASVLLECRQYSGTENVSGLDYILLSLRSNCSHVGNLLDEISVTRQRQVEDGVVAELLQLRMCLNELCVQHETKLLFKISMDPTQGRSVVHFPVKRTA